MSPPYHYPFIDPPSQGESHSTRLPVLIRLTSGSTMIKQFPRREKLFFGNEVQECAVRTSALRSQEYYDKGLSPCRRQ
eukprot:6212341-Pleurochrysis_carterae.AAC.4